MYSVTVETERSSALCTALPWRPSGALLCVQRYRGNRAELCFALPWKPSGALLCVTVETERSSALRYRGNLALSRSNSASRWQRINLHIYAATNSVSLWDYGINKFSCITVSLQLML